MLKIALTICFDSFLSKTLYYSFIAWLYLSFELWTVSSSVTIINEAIKLITSNLHHTFWVYGGTVQMHTNTHSSLL